MRFGVPRIRARPVYQADGQRPRRDPSTGDPQDVLKQDVFSTRSALVTVGFALAACDDSESGLQGEAFQGTPLATLNGALHTSQPAALSGEVSLALMWYAFGYRTTEPGDGPPPVICTGEPSSELFISERRVDRPGWVSQAIAFEPTFPIRFQLPIHQLPPAEARADLAELGTGVGETARGYVVAFIDTNGNGDLDLPSVNGPGDELLALDIGMSVIYLDGVLDPDPVTGEVLSVPQGFSLRYDEFDEYGGRISRGEVGSIEDEIVIEIPPSIEERKQAERWACTSVIHRDEFGPPAPPDFSPLFTNCSPERRAYDMSGRREVVLDRTCVLRRLRVRACLEPGAAVPDGWPCP